MYGQLRDHDLQRRPRAPSEKVAAMCRTVRLPYDDMRVQSRLAVLLHDISGKRQNLDLVIDGDLLVVFPLPVEKPQRDLAERTNAGQVSVSKPIRIGKFQEALADVSS